MPKSPGKRMMVLTSTRPVMAQTTTVSQKVPVADTSACLTGFFVFAAAATMGAEPRPASLEKRPRAMPKRAAIMTDAPMNPPPAACGVKADLPMRAKVWKQDVAVDDEDDEAADDVKDGHEGNQ